MVAAETYVNAAEERVNSSMLGVADELNAIGNQMLKMSDAISTLTAERFNHTRELRSLSIMNLQLRGELDAVNMRVSTLEAATNSTPPSCTPLANPANGKIVTIGEHGTIVPTGVVVDFACNDGYFLAPGSITSSTCQYVDNGQVAWSARHPGCTLCDPACAQCSGPTASECIACSNAAILVKDTCLIIGPGASPLDPAISCKTIRDSNPTLPSLLDGYWIKPTGQDAQRFYCLMDDKMGQGNGGWTMVGRGVGGNIACWQEAGPTGCNIDGTSKQVNIRQTFIYSDQTISGIPHTAILYSGFGSVKGNWVYSSGCTYRHQEIADGACNCPFETLDMTDSCIKGKAIDHHTAVGSWDPSGNVGCLHSRQSKYPTHGWYMRAGGTLDCSNFCRGNEAGCDVALYVR